MYIAYKNVAARGLYGCGSLSPSFASLTRGYALSEISTLVSAPDYRRYGPHAPNGPEQVLNPADIFSNCSSISYNSSSYNTHCYPSLIYPHGMQDADPAWRSCTTALKGERMAVFDPPRVLTPVAALGPATTKETAPIGVMSASPASTLSSPLVTKTDTPMVLASTSRSKLDPQHPSSVNMDQASNLNVATKTERLAPEESSFPVDGGSKLAIGPDARGSSLDETHATIIVRPQSLSDSSDHSDAARTSHGDSAISESISKRPDSIDPTPMIDPTSLGLDEAGGDENPTGRAGVLGALASMLLSVFQPPHSSHRKPEQTSHPFHPAKSTNRGFASLQSIDSLPTESTAKIPLQGITLPAEASAVSFAVVNQGGLSLAGTAHRSGPVIIAGSTVKPGATALPIHGHRISVDPAASNLVVDGQTLVLPSLFADAASQGNPSISSIARQVAQADSSQGRAYIINGQTLTPGGGESATISGTPVGFDADGHLVVGTSTVRGFHTDKHSLLDNKKPALLTIGSFALTIGVTDQGEGDNTSDALTPTTSGRTIYYDDDGLRIRSSLVKIASLLPGAAITGADQALTVIFPGDGGVNGKTLVLDGSSGEVAGMPVTLASGDELVIGTSTIPLKSLFSNVDITIGSRTYSASALPGEVAVTGATMYDRPSATAESDSASSHTSQDRAAASTPREPVSTSTPGGEVRGSIPERTSGSDSSNSASSTSNVCAIYIPLQKIYSLISTLVFWYFVLT